ncbi:MAG: hypothetical protein HY660_13265 [Armatimonadetes bacterium]|nr:hypothetical protein [Armatimonadota bacterium]
MRNSMIALFVACSLLVAYAVPALAGFEGGDSPAMASAQGEANASDTGYNASHVANQGASASDRANQATGIDSSGHPGNNRDQGGR